MSDHESKGAFVCACNFSAPHFGPWRKTTECECIRTKETFDISLIFISNDKYFTCLSGFKANILY